MLCGVGQRALPLPPSAGPFCPLVEGCCLSRSHSGYKHSWEIGHTHCLCLAVTKFIQWNQEVGHVSEDERRWCLSGRASPTPRSARDQASLPPQGDA